VLFCGVTCDVTGEPRPSARKAGGDTNILLSWTVLYTQHPWTPQCSRLHDPEIQF